VQAAVSPAHLGHRKHHLCQAGAVAVGTQLQRNLVLRGHGLVGWVGRVGVSTCGYLLMHVAIPLSILLILSLSLVSLTIMSISIASW
jgi:hypothetical protein